LKNVLLQLGALAAESANLLAFWWEMGHLRVVQIGFELVPISAVGSRERAGARTRQPGIGRVPGFLMRLNLL
jgi:hypothetical protein